MRKLVNFYFSHVAYILFSYVYSMPPFQLMSEFSPLALGKEFYQRSIRLEYVSNSLLLNNFQQDRANLNRLELEFNVEEDGNMKLKSIVGEKKRSVVDILGISG